MVLKTLMVLAVLFSLSDLIGESNTLKLEEFLLDGYRKVLGVTRLWAQEWLESTREYWNHIWDFFIVIVLEILACGFLLYALQFTTNAYLRLVLQLLALPIGLSLGIMLFGLTLFFTVGIMFTALSLGILLLFIIPLTLLAPSILLNRLAELTGQSSYFKVAKFIAAAVILSLNILSL